MPRTSDYFLDYVLYVFGSNETAVENKSPAGSGFLAAVPMAEAAMLHRYYAVTAAHVVRLAKTPFLRVNKTFINDVDVMEPPVSSWVQHPDGDDICMCPLRLATTRTQTLGIETARFVTADIVDLEACAGRAEISATPRGVPSMAGCRKESRRSVCAFTKTCRTGSR
jgi:hypothetical protein